jgi:hypothetical protein
MWCLCVERLRWYHYLDIRGTSRMSRRHFIFPFITGLVAHCLCGKSPRRGRIHVNIGNGMKGKGRNTRPTSYLSSATTLLGVIRRRGQSSSYELMTQRHYLRGCYELSSILALIDYCLYWLSHILWTLIWPPLCRSLF